MNEANGIVQKMFSNNSWRLEMCYMKLFHSQWRTEEFLREIFERITVLKYVYMWWKEEGSSFNRVFWHGNI